MFKRLRSLFRVLARRREFEDGMTEELRFHIEQYTDELVSAGMSREKAARLAQQELGSLTNVKSDCRESFGVHLFDEIRRQLNYAARLLRKTPGFTATALLTLAVCLGANLTIFAVIDSVLLRPLPFPESSPPRDDIQHVSESRRRSRRLVGDQLLRTPRSNSRFHLARNLCL